ncbi:nuclear transport factor 2 family protein [Streptomyces sp. NPDC093094]|uniref:nuclear transport factor 2 family protein n=1 Tax=Streptomyces sp. NPDC093094 TaxID=3366026 RepID=UPI0038004535
MSVDPPDTAERTLRSREFAVLYAQVQQFYGDQMRILDAHGTERWTGTFTDDAVLVPPSPSEPVRARAGVVRYLRAGAERLRRTGGRPAHWVGMLDVRPQEDGSLHTRCSALVYATPGAGGSPVLYVCVMEDVLVRTRGTWRTAYRRVVRDDLR